MNEVTAGYELAEPEVIYNNQEFTENCGDQPGRLGCYDYRRNMVIIPENYRFEIAVTEFDYEVREGIIRHEFTHAVLYQLNGDLGHENIWFEEKTCL